MAGFPHRRKSTKPPTTRRCTGSGLPLHSRLHLTLQLRRRPSFMPKSGWRGSVLIVVFCFFFLGCRSVYYSTWEKLGKYKRDLLKENVQEARDDQKKATEQFKDALTRLKEMYGFEGGNLEKTYSKLK